MKDKTNNMFKYIDRVTNSLFGLQDSINILVEKLTDETKQEIWDNDFYLMCSIGPGNTNKININTEGSVKNIVIIDQTLTCDILKFTPFETAAIILHEVGHILNKEPSEESAFSEFYADDYARSKNFGIHLLSGLKKYIAVIELYTNPEKGTFFFKSHEKQNQILTSLTSRINRIEKNEQLLINQNSLL